MPGRPVTMARKVGEYEEAAVCLSAEVFAAMPTQYREQPDSDDPVNWAWQCAVRATMQASIELERLGDLLRAKAEINEPGPTAQSLASGPGCEDGESEDPRTAEEVTRAAGPERPGTTRARAGGAQKGGGDSSRSAA